MIYRKKLFNYFCQRDRGWILTLLAAVCLVYLPFLGSPFIFDDLPFFSDAVVQRYATSLFQFDLRWLPNATLGWTYAIFSDIDTHFYHLGNTLLHAGNAILLFYLLRQLAGAVMDDYKNSRAVIWGAWFGALVFACHPVAVYAVGYVIERSILMATLFALVMQLAYVRGLLTGQKRWLVLAVIAYFLAGFSKEHSVLMPAVLAALTILLRDKNKLSKRALCLAWAAFVAIAVLLMLSAKGVIGTVYEPLAATMFNQQGLDVSAPMLHLLSALTQSGLFFKYLLLWWLPNPAWMSVDMREPFITTLTAWQSWVGVLGFMAYGALGCRLLLRGGMSGLIGLALLYPWLLFGVELSTIRVQEPFVLYRSYLWLPGMMLFFPWLLIKLALSPSAKLRAGVAEWLPSRNTLLTLAGIVLLLIPLAWNRLWVFADNYRLWNDAALLLPSERVWGADRVFYNRAESLALIGKWPEAASDFERAVALSPTFSPIHKELGVAYANSKRYKEAVAQFDAAIALDPEYAQAYYYKGMAFKMQHADEQAMKQMEKSCELRYAMACVIVKMAQLGKS